MYFSRLFAVLFLLPFAANGADLVTTSEGNCQVVILNKAMTDASWSGACADGLASGPGILQWKAGGKPYATYEGGVVHGAPEGEGYVKHADQTEYEGGFKDGLYHGKGIMVGAEGRYEGDWRAGKRDGRGTMRYTLGGSYDGQWRGGVFHGQGKAVYAGGGEYAGMFENGRREGQAAAPVAARPTYSLKSMDHRVVSRLPRELATSAAPLDKPYEAMTDAEKYVVRSGYPMLDEDDEPPFPAKGLKQIAEWVSKAQSRVLAQGDVLVHVKVDSKGNPTSAAIYQSPHPELASFVSQVLMRETYKPALCRGQPCAMTYAFKTRLSIE